MTTALHDVPPVPRVVRWRAVLGTSWPLLMLGFLFAIYGGAIGLMFLFHRQGKIQDDLDLDAGAARVRGRVIALLPLGKEDAGGDLQRAMHEFVVPSSGTRFGPLRQPGSSFVRGKDLKVGQEVDLEFLPGRPEVSRLAGGRISLAPDPLGSHLRYVWLPGVAFTLAWFVRMLRTRRLLAHGDATLGDLLAIVPVRACIPDMVRVHYSFRDRSAHLRTGTHWVRARGRLMLWIGEHADLAHGILVVHDRKRPQRSRLALPADFAGTRAPLDLLPEESKR